MALECRDRNFNLKEKKKNNNNRNIKNREGTDLIIEDKRVIELNNLILELSQTIEAILFSSSEPIPIERLIDEFKKNSELKIIKKAIHLLQENYRISGSALEIYQTPQKEIGIRVKREIMDDPRIANFTLGDELNKTELQILAHIAYFQPIEYQDIIDMFDKKAKRIIRKLIQMKFVEKKKTKEKFIDENDKEQSYYKIELNTTPFFADYMGIENNVIKIRESIEKFISR